MAANALRFGTTPCDPQFLPLADKWATEAGDQLLSAVFREFGAMELMVSISSQKALHWLIGRS